MSHPVIVGVDTTERAPEAVALGRLLAPALGAELVLAHVYPWDDRQYRWGSVGFASRLREDAEHGMEGLAALAGPDARMVTVPDTSPARGLHWLAELEGAQLLVTASSHRGPIGRTFLGDVAQRTLHAAPCAVAVAPRGFGANGPAAIATIGVGFDGGDESQAALALAAGLARELGSELRLLASSYMAPVVGGPGWVAYDTGPMQRAEETHLGELVDAAVAEQTVLCRGAVIDGLAIEELLRLSREVDLLVLGSRSFGPARRLLLGTTSDAVAREAACPVLVLPRGAADVPAVDERPLAARA